MSGSYRSFGARVRRGRSPRELLVAVSSLLVAAIGVELALRCYHLIKDEWAKRSLPRIEERWLVPSRDPQLLYELNPGWREGDFSVNSHGFVGEAVDPGKPAGVFRIALVGDSITCNFRLTPRAESYVGILERTLNAGADVGTRFELLNFGVNSYGLLQELQVVRTRVARFSPDLIVAQLSLNDPYPTDTEYAQPAPRHPLRTWSFVHRRLQPGRFWANEYVARNYDSHGIANLRLGIAGLAAESLPGRRVLAVLFPYLYRPAYSAQGFARYHAIFSDAARASGLEFVDLYAAFAQAGLIDDRWPKDPLHPDERGHQLAADAIQHELRRLDWLPEAVSRSPGRQSP